MAGVYISFTSGATALTGGTAQTVLQLVAATNQRIRIIEIELSFDGTNSANTPAQVRVMRQTGAGTSVALSTAQTGTAGIAKVNDLVSVAETIQSAGRITFSVEPTYAEVLRWVTVPVFGGTIVVPAPPGQEDMVPGGSRVGIVITAPQSVNVYATIRAEE